MTIIIDASAIWTLLKIEVGFTILVIGWILLREWISDKNG